MQTIEETMQEIRKNLSFLESMQKIEYLIDLSRKAKGLPASLKTDANKVYGCASATWLVLTEGNGKITITTDSDAAIVKGLLQLLEKSFNGCSKDEILAVDGQPVLNTIGFGGSITNRRMNGFASAVEMVQSILKNHTAV